MRASTFAVVVTTSLLLQTVAHPVSAQGVAKIPTISQRQFVGGSVTVTVRGSFQISQDVAINTKASYGDGSYTWLQFGASGDAAPNALITVGDQEIGIIVAKGKATATAEAVNCKGKIEVTSTTVTGQYTCAGVTSYDSGTMRMGTVDVEVRFSTKS